MASPQILSEFVNVVREFVLLNPTDDDITFGWSGETRVVPNIRRAILPHPLYSDVPCSAMTPDGKFIPGTLVLKDIWRDTSIDLKDINPADRFWNAADAIKHTLGIDPASGVALGKYALRGLCLLPKGFTRTDFEGIYKAGRERYERWRLVDARAQVQAFDEKNAKRRSLGMTEMPGGAEYDRSVALLKIAAEEERGRLQEALQGLETPTQSLPDWKDPIPPPVPMTRDELIASLLADEDTRKQLMDKLTQPEPVKSTLTILPAEEEPGA